MSALYLNSVAVPNAPLEPTALYLVARAISLGPPASVQWAVGFARTGTTITLYYCNGGVLTRADSNIANDPALLLLMRVGRPNWINEEGLAHIFNATSQGTHGQYDAGPGNSGRTFAVDFLRTVVGMNGGAVVDASLLAEMETAVQVAARRRSGATRYIVVPSSYVRG